MNPQLAALVHLGATAAALGLQLALAAGAPWGALTLGGFHRGRLPPRLRAAALGQALLLAVLTGLVLARAGVALPALAALAGPGIWLSVAVAGVASVLNLITPSPGERLVGAPLALVMLASSLVVALS
jgi:hypothetical protein